MENLKKLSLYKKSEDDHGIGSVKESVEWEFKGQ